MAKTTTSKHRNYKVAIVALGNLTAVAKLQCQSIQHGARSWAIFLFQIVHDLEFPSFQCHYQYIFIPGASVTAPNNHVKQHLRMSFHPMGSTFLQVLQDIQIFTPQSSIAACFFIPWTAVSCAYLKSSKCPLSAVAMQISFPMTTVIKSIFYNFQMSLFTRNIDSPSSHGHPCSQRYFRISKSK
jgi:hypothetical protein